MKASVNDESVALEACGKKCLNPISPVSFPVAALHPPRPVHAVRGLDKTFLEYLKEEYLHSYQSGFLSSPMIVAVYHATSSGDHSVLVPENTCVQDVIANPKNYLLEVIGGNHNRQAKCDLAAANPNVESFKVHPVQFYINLTTAECTTLGRKHNQVNSTSHKQCFRDTVTYMNHRWEAFKRSQFTLSDANSAEEVEELCAKMETESFRNKFRDTVLPTLGYNTKEEKNTASPYMQVAMQPEVVWKALEKVFEVGDQYKLKNQKAPKVKKVHRNSIEQGSIPKVSGSSSFTKEQLVTLTAGNLSTDDKVVILQELSSGNKSLEECLELATETKMINTLKQSFLSIAFPKVEKSTWKMAEERFGNLVSMEKLKVHLVKGKTKGSVKVTEAFQKWVSTCMCFSGLTSDEDVSMGGVDVINHQHLKFEFKRCNVLNFDELQVTKRHYSLVIIDPPYGLGLAPWDKKVLLSLFHQSAFLTLSNGAFAIVRCGMLTTFKTCWRL
jgi:hypothetical protein